MTTLLAMRPTASSAPPDLESWIADRQGGVWRYLRLLGAPPADAEDLTQETFLKFLANHEPRPGIEGLLRTVARGLWLDRQRWLRRRRAVEVADEVDAMLAGDAEDPHLDRWLDALSVCRGQLAPKARRAVDLTYRDGLDRRAVGAAVGLEPSSVRNLLVRARLILKECIEARLRTEEER